MIGSIIVPLDGSELAERALVYARGIAERTGSPIELVLVVEPDATPSEVDGRRDYLRRLSEGLPGEVGNTIGRGRPAEQVAEASSQIDHPIIVMSTHGRGGFRRWFTGSVAEEVIRTAEHPVILVRAGIELPDQLALHALMVPVDGSRASERALRYASSIAQEFGSMIHLVRVVDTPSAYAMLSRHMETAVTGDLLDEIIASMKREATDYLERIAGELVEKGLKVRTVILEGYPGEQLIEYERRGFFQLVVMATSARSGVGRVVFGSVAERVLKMGRSPVMMVRPLDTADPGGPEADSSP